VIEGAREGAEILLGVTSAAAAALS
jgi:hypothetical protein